MAKKKGAKTLKQAIVMDVNGAATFRGPDARKGKKIKPGVFIDLDSIITLKKDASVNLFVNESIIIDTEGDTDLANILDTDKKLKKRSIEAIFTGRLLLALSGLKAKATKDDNFGYGKTTKAEDDDDDTTGYGKTTKAEDDDDDTTGYGKVSGPDDDDTSDGWGRSTKMIYNVVPFGVKVLPKHTRLEWTELEGYSIYEVKIFKSDGDILMLSATVDGLSFEINLGDLDLAPDEEYYMLVEPKGTNKGQSNKSFFKITEMGEAEKAILKLRKSANYLRSSPVTQALMQAVVMERLNLMTEAYQIYDQTLTRDPKNVVARRMFAAFLWNNGYRKYALELTDSK